MDTRLYVQVVPLMEHKLPILGGILRDFIFDEVTEKQTTESLKDLLPKKRCVDRIEWKGGDLDRQCSEVCSHLYEHLQLISHAWIAYLRETLSEVNRVAREAKLKINHVQHIRSKYQRHSATIVDQEVRKELILIHTALDTDLERIRSRPFPVSKRPPCLDASCVSLKHMFSSLYGNVPTKELVRCKETFENSVYEMERSISEEFVKSFSSFFDH